jgi:hypothetical protein
MDFINKRLKEPSTYAGLMTLLMSFHVVDFSVDQQTAILGFIGLLLVTPDKQHAGMDS